MCPRVNNDPLIVEQGSTLEGIQLQHSSSLSLAAYGAMSSAEGARFLSCLWIGFSPRRVAIFALVPVLLANEKRKGVELGLGGTSTRTRTVGRRAIRRVCLSISRGSPPRRCVGRKARRWYLGGMYDSRSGRGRIGIEFLGSVRRHSEMRSESHTLWRSGACG